MEFTGSDRRGFLKQMLALGGTTALSACIGVEGDPNDDVPTGNPELVPERQFEWNDYLAKGAHGNTLIPNHQLLLFLEYQGEDEPSESDREELSAALRSLERAYQWGAGDEHRPELTRGLLFFIGYAPRYFDRFDEEPPDELPMHPEELIDHLDEDAKPDDADAVLVMNSDRAAVVLSAEQALRGRLDTLNGVSVEGTLTDVFDVVDRRTGFLGAGRPSQEFDIDIPDSSPTAMGFRSGFDDNQATEDHVTIGIGPFSGGTTAQISRLTLDLDAWWELDEQDRVQKMFSPEHTSEQVGEIGEHLGGNSQLSRETVDRRLEDVADRDIVGHTQKVGAARNANFEPRLLRRSEGVSTDLDEPGMNFLSLQQFMQAFIDVREAMNCPANGRYFARGEDEPQADTSSGCPFHAKPTDDEDNGIVSFMEVLSRGTYLVPPRRLRSFPRPNPESAQ